MRTVFQLMKLGATQLLVDRYDRLWLGPHHSRRVLNEAPKICNLRQAGESNVMQRTVKADLD